MADAMGISHTSVQRIWKEHGLKPHLVRHFKVSNDPNFVAKVKDIVGLYLAPVAAEKLIQTVNSLPVGYAFG